MKVLVKGQSASSKFLSFPSRLVPLPEDKIIDVSFEEVRDKVAVADMDMNDYSFLETVAFNPASRDKLLFETKTYSANGFGYSGQEMLLALNKLTDVYSSQPNNYDPDTPQEILDIGKKQLIPDCVGIESDVPMKPRTALATEIAGFMTTFETTRLDEDMVRNVNTYNFVMVNGKFMLDTMRDSGVTIPVYYVPLGVRSDIFTYFDRPIKEEFTFGHYGSLNTGVRRKGTEVLVEAFHRAFPEGGYPNVKLDIRSYFPMPDEGDFWNLYPQDTRIKTSHGVLPRKTILDLLHTWDCLVSPNRGEGFGLTLIESMATGLPTICTGWSAPTDYMRHKDTGLFCELDLVNADWYGPNHPQLGKGAEPRVESVAEQMKWVYEHRAEAKMIGKRASRYVTTYWTWERCARAILKAKEHYLTHHYHGTKK